MYPGRGLRDRGIFRWIFPFPTAPEDDVADGSEIDDFLKKVEIHLKAIAVLALETSARQAVTHFLLLHELGVDEAKWKRRVEELMEKSQESAWEKLLAIRERVEQEPDWGDVPFV